MNNKLLVVAIIGVGLLGAQQARAGDLKSVKPWAVFKTPNTQAHRMPKTARRWEPPALYFSPHPRIELNSKRLGEIAFVVPHQVKVGTLFKGRAPGPGRENKNWKNRYGISKRTLEAIYEELALDYNPLGRRSEQKRIETRLVKPAKFNAVNAIYDKQGQHLGLELKYYVRGGSYGYVYLLRSSKPDAGPSVVPLVTE